MAILVDTKIIGDLNVANEISASGDLIAARVHNAVWNDIADFVEVPEGTIIEYGRAYARDKDKVRPSKKSDKNILGIASDTYGFGVGKKENVNQEPFAIGGWVLAFTEKIYEFGTPLTFGNNGILKKANWLTRLFSPEKVVATFDRVEKEKIWYRVEVNGRNWVRIL